MIFIILYGEIAGRNTSFLEKDVFFFPKKNIEILVEGEVKKPGCYRLPAGTTFQEVFEKAKIKRFANMRSFCLQETIASPCKITVPKLTQLEIVITGAIEGEKNRKVAAGTRVSDLKKILKFLPKADKSCLSSRRYICDQEQFFIPFQEKKKQSLEMK